MGAENGDSAGVGADNHFKAMSIAAFTGGGGADEPADAAQEKKAHTSSAASSRQIVEKPKAAGVGAGVGVGPEPKPKQQPAKLAAGVGQGPSTAGPPKRSLGIQLKIEEHKKKSSTFVICTIHAIREGPPAV